MNRREFLRKAAIIAAGVVAVDQLELLERLAPRRLYWPGADFGKPQYIATISDLDRLLRETYAGYDIPELFPVKTPLARKIVRPLFTHDRGIVEVTYNVRLA